MSSVVSLMGWAILPNLVSGWVQSVYYGLTIRAGAPRPAPGTPRYVQDRRRIQIAIISLYLLYTIYEADYELVNPAQHDNYFMHLSVPYNATAREIKSSFRKLSRYYHTDKAPPGTSEATLTQMTEIYVLLQKMADTLTNPDKRFAYERFGPVVVGKGWEKLATAREFLTMGMTNVAMYYVAVAAAMYVFGLLGYLDFGRWWRWTALAVVACFEVHVLTRSTFPAFLEHGINPFLERFTSHPPYLPFQVIALARKLSVTLYIALSQLGPLLKTPVGPGPVNIDNEERALKQGLDRLDQSVGQLNAEASRLLDMEMAPFAGDAEALSNVRGKVKEWLVQNTIRADPMVRDAVGKSLRKRRLDAPAGAKGNR